MLYKKLEELIMFGESMMFGYIMNSIHNPIIAEKANIIANKFMKNPYKRGMYLRAVGSELLAAKNKAIREGMKRTSPDKMSRSLNKNEWKSGKSERKRIAKEKDYYGQQNDFFLNQLKTPSIHESYKNKYLGNIKTGRG